MSTTLFSELCTYVQQSGRMPVLTVTEQMVSHHRQGGSGPDPVLSSPLTRLVRRQVEDPGLVHWLRDLSIYDLLAAGQAWCWFQLRRDRYYLVDENLNLLLLDQLLSGGADTHYEPGYVHWRGAWIQDDRARFYWVAQQPIITWEDHTPTRVPTLTQQRGQDHRNLFHWRLWQWGKATEYVRLRAQCCSGTEDAREAEVEDWITHWLQALDNPPTLWPDARMHGP